MISCLDNKLSTAIVKPPVGIELSAIRESALPNPLKQRCRGRVKRPGEPNDGRKPRLPRASLQSADLCRVKVACLSQFFLRPAAIQSRLLEVAAKPLVRLHVPGDAPGVEPKPPEPKPLFSDRVTA